MATHSSILAWRILMDREAWQATVHKVSESGTLVKRLITREPGKPHMLDSSLLIASYPVSRQILLIWSLELPLESLFSCHSHCHQLSVSPCDISFDHFTLLTVIKIFFLMFQLCYSFVQDSVMNYISTDFNPVLINTVWYGGRKTNGIKY